MNAVHTVCTSSVYALQRVRFCVCFRSGLSFAAMRRTTMSSRGARACVLIHRQVNWNAIHKNIHTFPVTTFFVSVIRARSRMTMNYGGWHSDQTELHQGKKNEYYNIKNPPSTTSRISLKRISVWVHLMLSPYERDIWKEASAQRSDNNNKKLSTAKVFAALICSLSSSSPSSFSITRIPKVCVCVCVCQSSRARAHTHTNTQKRINQQHCNCAIISSFFSFFFHSRIRFNNFSFHNALHHYASVVWKSTNVDVVSFANVCCTTTVTAPTTAV